MDAKDELGRRAIDIATPKYKHAMMERVYFYRRYELVDGPAEHVSATCIVRIAKDRLAHDMDVALKFIHMKDHFEREIQVRQKCVVSPKYVVNTITEYDGDADPVFSMEASKKDLYNYCLVMPAAERNLSAVLAHEHIAGRDWDKLRLISKQLVMAVGHLHGQGLVHGDIKPLNVVRIDGDYRLIDLDAAIPYREGLPVGVKYSSAYVPPEMLAIVSGEPVVRSYTLDESKRPITSSLSYELLPAHPSFDIWSLGVTLYHVFCGETLFNANDEGNIDLEQREILYHWTDEFKNKKLDKITDALAHNLLYRLLSKDSSKRPDIPHILVHPFLSNKNVSRLVGEEAEYDVFISYRVASDSHHAAHIYHELTKMGLRVWWDQTCLQPGVPWEEGFCDGLVNCRAFVPLLSRGAINHPTNDRLSFAALKPDTPYCDNVLLEYRLALELRAFYLIETIFPVMIGDSLTSDIDSNEYTHYFASGCHPEAPPVSVEAVEVKLREHLDRQGLGAPMTQGGTVKDVLGELTACQGGFVVGAGKTAFSGVLKSIESMVHHLKKNRSSGYARTRSREQSQRHLKTLSVSGSPSSHHNYKMTALARNNFILTDVESSSDEFSPCIRL